MTSKNTHAAASTAQSPVWSPAQRARTGAIRPRILTRAADLESGGVRRGLQIALGLVWLLDAALQFQPYMFGRALVSQVLEPTAMGNPAVFASPALWADRLITHGLPAWNAAFALIQLAIALGLLWRPAVKAALATSIVWSLGAWWVAEGLGGVLTGTASPVTGAPGAVILYALLAVLVWPRRSVVGDNGAGHGGVAAASPLGSRWSAAAWLVLWGSFAYLILQPAVRAPRALSGTLAGEAAGEPGWLAAVDRGVATATGSHGMAISVVLASAFILIAAGIFFAPIARPALVLAIIVGLGIWVVGENFGEIATGTATDPNTGPLLILLAAAYWPLIR